ncbi:4-hydroxythreonine-4-phosphate dehydrogenase PdxA [Methyloligella sp. 2.7D]|uniref:4-hydroxythreonine-4-phosphate dehydrogenase PdxA n=1 Tax=unclassified Methyloligella TaxID=2625955 RepID=UPI00157C8921|nr:4-hydroxythreonine-4-phosphate dehydrogenase PdxA [Methyloligella sp. GL2]QKP77472.1 4-hydroxythreonine-4-phosphate dehydrogenase PdxA [Methyloligella sp. GL2]
MSDKPLALTMGDPAGIGPDITLLAWQGRELCGLPPFMLLADPDLIAARAETLGLDIPIAVIDDPAEASAVFSRALPVLPVPLSVEIAAGTPDPAAAPAIQGAIEQAVDLVMGGKAAAVVTNPIAKEVLHRAGFPFPGHTEYLAALADPKAALMPVMLLASDALKIVPVTIHIPLREVPAQLTTELILKTIRITANDIRRYFGIPSPRLALTGLNPHAGENGSLGDEEQTIIMPAIDAAQAEGIDVAGPFPADTMFHERARAEYDVALAMYHDQALIPVKTLCFDTGVNTTLGLPFIRTSPDHGTAFAIAGTGKAHPTSLIEALKLARAMAGHAAEAKTSAA